MLTNGCCKNFFFTFSSEYFEIFYRVAMLHSLYLLFNNRTLIKLRNNIMRSCSDKFHSSFIGFLIRFCSNKRGKK